METNNNKQQMSSWFSGSQVDSTVGVASRLLEGLPSGSVKRSKSVSWIVPNSTNKSTTTDRPKFFTERQDYVSLLRERRANRLSETARASKTRALSARNSVRHTYPVVRTPVTSNGTSWKLWVPPSQVFNPKRSKPQLSGKNNYVHRRPSIPVNPRRTLRWSNPSTRLGENNPNAGGLARLPLHPHVLVNVDLPATSRAPAVSGVTVRVDFSDNKQSTVQDLQLALTNLMTSLQHRNHPNLSLVSSDRNVKLWLDTPLFSTPTTQGVWKPGQRPLEVKLTKHSTGNSLDLSRFR